MFLPVGHDQSSVRRLPWVTFTLMGLCVVVFLLTLAPVQSSKERMARSLTEIAEYFFAHPNLELEPEIEEYLFGFVPEYQGQREAFKEVLKEGVTGFGLFDGEQEEQGPEETEAEQQAELDRLTAQFHKAIKSSPYFELGLVPADQHIYAYITHQFMHGGWMHLIGNLLFLYLAGPYLEDVWGRPLFAGFYLSAGVFAALVYVLKYPLMEGPMVGASGAIAGLMGAFLVRYGGTKIKFLFFFFMTPRFFDAPAWLMLPLWLLREVFYGQAVDFGGGQSSGVAHWAHVAGFVYGLVIAAGVKQLKFEEKYVDTALESQAIQHQNLDLEEALDARQRGQLEKAEEILLSQLKANPGDFDAAMAYWDVRRDIGAVAPAVPFVLRVFRDVLRKGQHDLVTPRWPEILEMAPPGSIDPSLAARVAETVGDELGEHTLQATVDAGAAGVTPETPVGVLARLTRVGAAVGACSARTLAEQALASMDLPNETRAEIEGLVAGPLASVGPASAPEEPSPVTATALETDESVEPTITMAPEDHQLEIMEAVPTAWEDGVLTLSIGGKSRPMALNQVQALAVAGIAQPGQAPFVIVDLMLDAPWSKRVKLRIIRLSSKAFDPSGLVEGPDPMSCFRQLLVEILEVSDAAPLPDPDAAVGNPFQRFAAISDYEQEVIGLTS